MRLLPRHAPAVVLSLAAVVVGGHLVQQRLYAPATVRDLTPPPEAAAVVGGSPARATDRSAGAVVASVAPGWLRRTAAASGLSEPALDAYARAELMAPDGCGVGWATLAGVGSVESHHGTLGGRTLGADGRSSSPILGPALDGEDGFRAIAATPASAAMHGDPRWDHAVGPMQFIPTTWEAWAVDGDNDGAADPHDLDDAAVAAAGYLCAGGRDLTTAEGWTAGVLSYNRSRAYVDAVHAAATSYAERSTR